MKGTKKAYDIVLYGSTGFTGKLVAAYLDKHPQLLQQGKSWAIAGRTQSKLDALKSTLTSSPGVLCVSLDDVDAVDNMVQKARVVITCAGPYSLYKGNVLLGSCARNGVHYSDLAGEAFFQREMVTQYHALAKSTGAKIVLGGGIDSIPSDIGAMMAINALNLSSDQKATLQGVYTRYCGSFSGGTLNSGRAGKKARKGLLPGYPYSHELDADPYVLSKGVTGIETSNTTEPSGMVNNFKWCFDSSYGALVSFFMAPINARVVRRSFVLRNEEQRFSYAECSSLCLWLHMMLIWMSRGFGYFVGEPINFKPKSGEGPPNWLLAAGSFCVEVKASEITTTNPISAHSWLDVWPLNVLSRSNVPTATATVSGNGDPGYGATSKLLAELGLCLAFDEDKGGLLVGGVLTPSTAVGDVYVERLKKCSFMTSVKVVVNGKKMD